MKQVMFISVLALIMIIGFGGSLSSKIHPDGYVNLAKPESDDHPWGGEQWTGVDPLKSSQPKIPVITSFPLIDYFFSLYVDRLTANIDGSQSKSGANSVRTTSVSRNIVVQDNINQESSIRR